jgi:hypothetical protein
MKKLYISAIAILFSAASADAQTTPRTAIVEGFTSNTCGPCAGWNASYGPIIEANNPNTGNGIAVLKYQMDWPSPGNDPSNNDDADSRRGYYGVSGIPDWFIDGDANDGSQSQINSYQANPSELLIETAYTITGNDLDIQVDVTPLVYLGAGARLYVAIANKEYNYSGGTNGESNFKHVFRKMLPAPNGAYMAPLTANVVQNYNYQYTYTVGTPDQTNNNFWDNQIEIVVWVQKTTKEVLNAGVAGIGVLGIEEGDNDDFGLVVYPNPASDVANFVFDGDGFNEVVVEVYNNLGQMVHNQNHGTLEGRQKLELNTTEFEAGMYFVKVLKGNTVATSSMLLAK